ncbi:MAG TPA: hypothetical protein VGK77_21860 [Candidatus Binatia bacterium]
MIKIAERHDVTPRDVIEITCAAAPNTFHVLIHHRPTTSLEAKFSLEYLLSAGLALKTINEGCFALKHVNDPVMRDLVAKVRVVDSPAKRETPGEGAVTVQVRTPVAVYEETVSYAPGHPKNPLSWQSLAAKYQACARHAGLSETAVASSLDTLSRSDEIGNVKELLQLFS